MQRNILSRAYLTMIACALLSGFSLPAIAASQQPLAESFPGAYLAGRIALNDNQTDIAIDYLSQALDFDSGNEVVQRDLFLTYLNDGAFKKAVSMALLLQNNAALARFTRPTIAANAMNRKQFKQAISIMKYPDPNSFDVITCGIFTAWAKFGQGQRRAAINDIKALEGEEWFRFLKNYHLALMYSLNGEYKEAEKAFQAAIQDRESGAAFPDSFERVIIAYAHFQWGQKKHKAAIQTLLEAEKLLSGRNTLSRLRLAAQNGYAPPAIVQSARDGTSEITYNMATALSRANVDNVAILYLHIALAMRPGDDATLFQLADLSGKLKKPQNAIGFYKQIKPSSPYYYDSQLRMALNLADSQQEDKAILLLNQLVKKFGNDERLYTSLAAIYMQQNNFTNTVQVLDQYLGQLTIFRSENWSLFYQRGVAHEQLKQWDKAETDFYQALKLRPNQPQVLNYLGYSLIDRNLKLDEALTMIKTAAQLRPQDGYIIDSLGWAYYKLGRFNDAVGALERAVKLRPEDATINDHLGDAYWMIGRKLDATFQWNHASAANKIEPDALKQVTEKLKYGLKADGSINVPSVNDTPTDQDNNIKVNTSDVNAALPSKETPASLNHKNSNNISQP